MNEETILQGQTTIGNNSPEEVNNQKSSSAWKQVSIGGVTGILIGAGAMYGARAYADNQQVPSEEDPNATPDASNGVKVAEVSDDMSFKEAFDAAREQVGAGGVFRWHGGIYNTYTAEEWNSMSDAEKSDFAQLVQPEVSAGNIDTAHITNETPDIHVHVHVHEAVDVPQPTGATASGGDPQGGDDDVHIVAYGQVDGHAAVAIDLDDDGQPDVAIIDVDDSHSYSAPDVVVDTEGNMATVGELEAMAQEDPALDPNFQTASLDNPDVAPDMPDYTSDADLGILG